MIVLYVGAFVAGSLALIYSVALRAARGNWWSTGPTPAAPAAYEDRCPHCGGVHAEAATYDINGDGANIEDYYFELALD